MPEGPFLVGNVLYNDSQKVADFILSQFPGIDVAHWESFTALGVVQKEALVGGVVFHHYHPRAKDIEISAAFANARWCLPNTVKQLFSYPLNQLGCTRISARTGRRNSRARAFLERLDFRVEGVARRAYDGKQDVIHYGLLVPECGWLKGK